MPCLQFLEGCRCWEDGRGQKNIAESRDWGLTASLVPIFIESSCVDYASFDFEPVNTFTDGKDREIPRRVPAAKGAVARPLQHHHPAEDRRYNPIDRHQALGRRGAGDIGLVSGWP